MAPVTPSSVDLIEDDAAVRASLVALLKVWGFDAHAFSDGESYLAEKPWNHSACLLLDYSLPGRNGLEILSELHGRAPDFPVIMITGHGDVALAVRALKAGARDFIEKPYEDEDLREKIENLIRSQDFAGARGLPDQSSLRAFETLTPREMEVMMEVVAGHSNKVIAHHLTLSPKTVEVHRARVMAKTGAKNLSNLVRLAIKAGLDGGT
ncbi:MAG: response regulator [Alphaproteobacteria bacterium]|nr:response regulator [Alphaproteobacteria bacterium]